MRLYHETVIRKAVVIISTHIVTPPRWGAEYCDELVCLCVCVCLRAYLWNRWTDLHEILYAAPLWQWLGPPLAALRYVMYFWFYG